MALPKAPCASESFVAYMREKWGDGVLVYNLKNDSEIVWFTRAKLNPFVSHREGGVVVYSIFGSKWDPLSPGTGWGRVQVVSDRDKTKCGVRLVDRIAGFPA